MGSTGSSTSGGGPRLRTDDHDLYWKPGDPGTGIIHNFASGEIPPKHQRLCYASFINFNFGMSPYPKSNLLRATSLPVQPWTIGRTNEPEWGR